MKIKSLSEDFFKKDQKIKAITFILEKFLNQRNLHMTCNEPKENCIWKQLEDFLDKLQRNAF